ncbi:glycoside hydrolase family 15 protein [Mycena floridula]|nr:glycoside hydrolase family 15 protein [Mycena floridula]
MAAPRDYVPIADHALIGNLHTAALISVDASVESYCLPTFDSPSVFARILDKVKGGHFSIRPSGFVSKGEEGYTIKQNYLPSSNVLHTKFLGKEGVVGVTDFLPKTGAASTPTVPTVVTSSYLGWLVRKVECIRGTMEMEMECCPAFNYALDAHSTALVDGAAIFESASMNLELDCVQLEGTKADVKIDLLDLQEHKGPSAKSVFVLKEGESLVWCLRMGEKDKNKSRDIPSPNLLKTLLASTMVYWNNWIRKSTYNGSWKEAVHRSALALKMLIYEPTGAVIASPTFSLPEYIGGTRNWDYRFSWIRDSSFTLYALLRLGFTEEADAYLAFIFDRLRDKNPDGSIQIMYGIRGNKDLEEIELLHLDGHKGSKPVRIGNGAADHVQLDVYGELMDCIYLGQKFGKPLSYDDWVLVRELVDYAVKIHTEPDLSIWEVRDKKRHFTYSKIMLWVAIDRGLRIASKRSLPCPNYTRWLEARDGLYEEIMHKSYSKTLGQFGQSYEEPDVLDSAVLVMPLVFFMQGSDPRFTNTLKQILKSPENGGLCSNNLIYRYDTSKSSDGVGGEEGTFCLCTLWCVEALTRAGQYDKKMLRRAVGMFEDFLLYLNHVGLCTEEVSDCGEALGNAVQAFTHVTLISAAYNLSRTLGGIKEV